MNGFAHHGLDEGDFGDNKGPSLKAFDAFRMLPSPLPNSYSPLSGSARKSLQY